MSSSTANMGLTQWDTNDYFSHTLLAGNWALVDQHDHSSGKGVQIATGGIAPLAIGTSQIQDGAVVTAKLATNAIVGDRIQDGTLPAAKLVVNSVGATQLAVCPQARVTSSTAFSVPNNAATAIQFDTAILNNPTNFWVNTSPTKLTAPVSGIYLINAVVNWGTSAGGSVRRLYIYRNATEFVTGNDSSPSSTYLWQNVSTSFYLAANDYVEVYAYQNSGGALSLTKTTNFDVPEFRMVWLSN